MSSNTIFEIMADLRATLGSGSDDEIWTSVEQLDTEVTFAGRPDEQAALRRLKEAVSTYMHDRRKGHLNSHAASVAITSLETIAKRGAVGRDGWPLR